MPDIGQLLIQRCVNGYLVSIQYPGWVDCKYAFNSTADMCSWLLEEVLYFARVRKPSSVTFMVTCRNYTSLFNKPVVYYYNKMQNGNLYKKDGEVL